MEVILLIKARLKLFLEPTSTKHWG